MYSTLRYAPAVAFAGAMLAAGTASAQTVSAQTAQTAAAPTAEVVISDARIKVYDQPDGQTETTIDWDQFKDGRDFSIGDIVIKSPGVTVMQGNGPRDVSISIRGSNARNGFGVRNIMMFEDGFRVTQPDGLGRTDNMDPHAYGQVDVIRGPSSALYGNFATGGAINFQTRRGRDINGVEVGTDVGSYGYLNSYLSWGKAGKDYEFNLFNSYVRGSGFTQHTAFNTTTQNYLATYDVSPDDKVTVKFLNNILHADLSIRLSLNQYNQNPYQNGCANLSASGCASVSVFQNGYNGARVSASADQLGLGRNDFRTIGAMRWEHSFDADTLWRTQFIWDQRNISQPTSATSAIGQYPALTGISDLTKQGSLFGLQATHYAAIWYNFMNNNGNTYNVMPGGNANLGGQTQSVQGFYQGWGVRGREELTIDRNWKAVMGLGVEQTQMTALQTAYTYPTITNPQASYINTTRNFLNAAPEASLIYSPTTAQQYHVRVGTGYGTPQLSNLFVTQQGVPGNNTQLKPQTNVGFDIGGDWTIVDGLRASATGFYEFFQNELVSQSPGAGLLNYTYNAPASQHRGIELWGEWRPFPKALPGAKFLANYTYDNQIYTNYTETLSNGGKSTSFNRDGNYIPGVPPNFISARLAYDQPDGALRGLGGYFEWNGQSPFYVDNANLVQAPGFNLFNFNLHYDPGLDYGYAKDLHLFFEVRNIFNKTWVASATNVTDSISATTGAQNGASSVMAATGSIWAGAPRSVYAGVRLTF